MLVNKFYVLKDDIVASEAFDDIASAEAAALELRDAQKMVLLTSRKVLKLFKKGIPLNLSDYSICCIVKEVKK